MESPISPEHPSQELVNQVALMNGVFAQLGPDARVIAKGIEANGEMQLLVYFKGSIADADHILAIARDASGATEEIRETSPVTRELYRLQNDLNRLGIGGDRALAIHRSRVVEYARANGMNLAADHIAAGAGWEEC